MQYFSYISNTYACKNKLYKDVLAFLHTQNRKVINKIDLEIFKKNIELEIVKINLANPHCKALTPDWYSPGLRAEIDFTLSLGYNVVCNFHLYQSN